MRKGILANLFNNKITTKDGRHKRRSFTHTQKTHLWYSQDGKCKMCGIDLDLRTVKFDHIKRWSQLGMTYISNGQALCSTCHSIKTFDENLKIADTKNEISN